MPLDLAKLRRVREDAGLTQREASANAGFKNWQQWQRIESGKHRNPTLDTLEKMAAAIGVKARQLLKDPEP